MVMSLRSLFKHRGLGINLIAGFCFLMLAVYGWGLGWGDLGGYFVVIIIFLLGLICFAALLGWLLRKWIGPGKNHKTSANKTAAASHTKKPGTADQDVKRD
jgi:uncharacterized SAM-binding protein YcdF (DUF218 family)